MNHRWIVPALFLLSLFPRTFASPLQQSAPGPDSGITVLIREGDSLTSRFDNHGALDSYRRALALDSTNVEILWRISRAYIDIGEHLPVVTGEQQDEQLRTYELSLDFAEKAVRANPRNSMAWTRRSIAKGRIALFRGIWESVSLVKQTKADIDTALALDPSNDVANYILGRIHAKVTEKPRIVRWPLGLSWANIDEAIKYYEKAIALKPEFIMYRLDCARAYLEDDNYSMARKHLEVIPSIPTKDEDDGQFRKEAGDLIKQLAEEGH